GATQNLGAGRLGHGGRSIRGAVVDHEHARDAVADPAHDRGNGFLRLVSRHEGGGAKCFGHGEILARRLRLLADLPCGHRAAARPAADSTAALVSELRSGSRGANLLPPSGRETIRAANNRYSTSENSQ